MVGTASLLVFDSDISPQPRLASTTQIQGPFMVPCGTWHSLLPGSEGLLFYEVRPGPLGDDTEYPLTVPAPAEIMEGMQYLRKISNITGN